MVEESEQYQYQYKQHYTSWHTVAATLIHARTKWKYYVDRNCIIVGLLEHRAWNLNIWRETK